MKILVLNSGSSSQQACLYEISGTFALYPPTPLWEGRIEWNGDTAAMVVKNSKGVFLKEELPVSSRERVPIMQRAQQVSDPIGSTLEIDAVGHRVVHGGAHFKNPVVITDKVRAVIESVSAFAPLHIRAELEGIKIVEDLLGAVTQVAVFDTAFHSQIPPSAAIYPGPYEWFENGIRRYGFHGINHTEFQRLSSCLLGIWRPSGCSALTGAINMSRINSFSFRARQIRTLCCCFVVHNIFLRNGQELPAFGHSNTRTGQEAPVFSLVRQWHPACVNTTEQRSAAPRLPDGDRR
jgi:Acetokinase family